MVKNSRKKKNKGLYQRPVSLSRVLTSTQATELFGKELLAITLPRVWLLRGDLGAGKTTLVRGVLRGLGVRARVTSPTFGLLKVYPVRGRGWKRVVHVDAYRLRHRRELAALGLDTFLNDPRTLIMIEWPEQLRGYIRQPVTRLVLQHHRAGRRVRVSVRV